MEEELASLKRTLISLVVSSPTTMTVNSLVKDYRNMVGGALPVAKFGYRDYITFLKERCQDIFVIEGSRLDPILTPKITKNLKHIDQMVQKQKVQSSIKNKGKRRSVPGQRNDPVEQNLIARTFNKSERHNGYGTNTPIHRETKHETQTATSKNKETTENLECTHENIKNQSAGDTLDKEPACSAFNNNQDIDNNIEESRPSSALNKFYKKRMPQYSSHAEFPSTEHVSDSQSSGSSSSRQSRLEELKGEIVSLITESADAGVWYTDLGRLYKERYERELCLRGCGITSISKLVSGLQDRISISRPEPTGDWLLQDPSRAGAGVGAGAGRRRAALYRPAPAPSAEPDDALPGIEFDADVFPADCMHYMDSVPGAEAGAEAGAGAQFEVLIGEVYSPSHFWMLRVGPQHNLAMEDIMDEMTEYYGAGAGAGRVLACGALRVGQHCAALYDADWHRALIVKLIDSDTVKVRHVDYGTVDTVSAAALKPLKRCWGSLPAQALRARLAGCRPCAAGRRWPRASCAGFLARVRDKRLYANVVAVDAEEDILETFLIDTSGPKDVCITRELVRLGHADERTDSALRSDESYLYPRFEALESGETLNYAEIQNALANGISLDYVDAYRRHVPGLTGPPVVSRAPRPPANLQTSAEPHRPTPRPLLASQTSAEPQRPTPRTLLASQTSAEPQRSTPRPLLASQTSAEPQRPTPRPLLASQTSAEPQRPTPRPLLSSQTSAEPQRPMPRPLLASPTSAELQRPTFRPVLSVECPPPAPLPPRPFELLNRVPLLRIEDGAPAPGRGAARVRLSAAESAVLAQLRATDPAAAHWYLLTTAWRSLQPPPPPPPPGF